MTTTKDKTCAERIAQSYTNRIEDLNEILTCSGDFAHCEDLMEGLSEYGLGFDYVEHDEEEEKEDFWRFQISWGGPSEEFRIYTDFKNGPIQKIEYWFLDWFDGTSKDVTNNKINKDWSLKDFFETNFLYMY
jgi:hypothetical protein